MTGISRRIAFAAAQDGLVDLLSGELDAAIAVLSAHSLRVGVAQDLFAAGVDGTGIMLTLRWSSPSTALRYGRQFQVENGVAARVLSQVRSQWHRCRPHGRCLGARASSAYKDFMKPLHARSPTGCMLDAEVYRVMASRPCQEGSVV